MSVRVMPGPYYKCCESQGIRWSNIMRSNHCLRAVHAQSFLRSLDASEVYTTRPTSWQNAHGKNNAADHTPVLSSRKPTAVTPSTPGNAPKVLLRPSKAPAYCSRVTAKVRKGHAF